MYAWMTSIRSIYLSEVLRYSKSPRLLRSSSQNFLAVPRSRLKTYGDRAFSVVAPKLWNQLLPELRGVETVDQFRTHLKTCLLTIRPVALSGYGSIAHEAKPNGLLTRGP